MYLCLNQTQAHDSLLEDRTNDLDLDLIKIPKTLNVKIGNVLKQTLSNIIGTDIFQHILQEGETILSAYGNDLKTFVWKNQTLPGTDITIEISVPVDRNRTAVFEDIKYFAFGSGEHELKAPL